VQPGGLQTEGLHRRRRQQGGKAGDHALAGQLQRFRDQGIGLETGSALTRHLVAREQGRCVHVVLQELPGQHQVAHPHARPQASGHTGEDDAAHPVTLGQQGRRGGGSHLADAAQHHHHRLAVQVAAPEIAACMALALLARHEVDQAGNLFVQGGHNGQGGTNRGIGIHAPD